MLKTDDIFCWQCGENLQNSAVIVESDRETPVSLEKLNCSVPSQSAPFPQTVLARTLRTKFTKRNVLIAAGVFVAVIVIADVITAIAESGSNSQPAQINSTTNTVQAAQPANTTTNTDQAVQPANTIATTTQTAQPETTTITTTQATQSENTTTTTAQTARSSNSTTAKTMFDEGVEFYNAENYDAAIDYFTRVIGIDSKYTEAYFYRGDAYRMKSDYDRAIQDMNKALEFNPQFALAYAVRGAAYLGKGGYDAIGIDSQGEVYYINSDYDHAIADYEKALQIDPTLQWAKDRLTEARGW
jgi:tetratricopeptide (TPR) repeat protein